MLIRNRYTAGAKKKCNPSASVHMINITDYSCDHLRKDQMVYFLGLNLCFLG